MTEYAFRNAPGAPNFSFEDLLNSPDTKLLIRTFGMQEEQVAGVAEGGLLFWLRGEEITKAMAAFQDPTKVPASTRAVEDDVAMNPLEARGFSFEFLRDASSRKPWLICEDTYGRDLVGAVNEQDTIIWLEGKKSQKRSLPFRQTPSDAADSRLRLKMLQTSRRVPLKTCMPTRWS